MMKHLKFVKFLLIFLLLATALIIGFPEPAAAASAWTGAWTTIGSIGSGGPANPWSIAADQSGNVFITNGSEIDKLPAGSAQWETVTGSGLSSHPDSIAVDKEGNLYISDSNSSVVQELPAGSGQWGNIGGIQAAQIWIPGQWVEETYYIAGIPYYKQVWSPGFWSNGTTNIGTIYVPLGVTVDDNLNVYVTNQGYYDSLTYYHSCEMLNNGTWSVIGNQYYNSLYYINDVATDSSGSVYVTTQYSSATRQGRDAVFKYSGGSWSQIGNTGTGTNMPVMPGGIAVDKWGNIYVVSHGDHTVKVFTDGRWLTIGGYGASGPSNPTDVAVDGSGNVYITDSTNKVVMKLQAPATQLVWVTQPGDGVAGHPWAQPPAVALVDANGNVETGESTQTVTLTLNNANGATLKNATVKLQNGVATFSGLTVSAVGSGYTLTPSCSLSSGLTPQTSNPFGMSAPPGPSVTGINPVSGVGGTRVTITGSNITAASQVEFGAVAGVNLVVNSDTSVTVTAPTHLAGPVDVTVTTPGGKSNAITFTYNQPGVWVGSWATIGNLGNGGFSHAFGIAVDKDGNVYSAENQNNQLKMLSGGTWSNIYTGTAYSGLTDVFVVDNDNNTRDIYYTDNTRVFKNGTVIFASNDYGNYPLMYNSNPLGVAADKSGTVYVGSSNKVWKRTGSTWTDITYGGGFVLPFGITVDSLANVYAADSSTKTVKKLAAGSDQWTTIGSGFGSLYGVTVDSSGNVFAADYGSNVIRELQVGASSWTYIGLSFRLPNDVAIDSSGNLYVTGSDDYGKSLVEKHSAPATQLVWQTQPGDGYAGKDLAPYPTLALKDAYGNTIASDSSSTVTLSLDNANGASLSGTVTVTLVNGVAHFIDLRIDRIGAGYALTPSFSMGNIAASNSNSFSIAEAPSPPAPIAWTGSWTTVYSGTALQSAVGIAVNDNLSIYEVDQSKWRVMNWIGDGNWYPIQTTGLAQPSGVAVKTNGAYTDVYIADSGNYRVMLNGSTLGGSFSGGYNLNSVAAGGDGSVYAVGYGYGYTAPFVSKWNNNVWSDISCHGPFKNPSGVAVDGSGNLYVVDEGKKEVYFMPAGTTQWKTIGTGFSDPTGIAVDGSGNIYVADKGAGTVKALQAGRADWVTIPGTGTYGVTGVTVDKYGYIYVAYNSYIYKHQPPATQLVWGTQPGGGTAGTAWSQQPVLYLKDINGNTISNDSSSTVTVTLVDAGGAMLGGTTQVTLQNGIATFGNLKVNEIGSFKLKASCSNLNSTDSNSFNITMGAPAQLAWNTQPDGGGSGQTWARQPVLYLEDAGGNIIAGNSTSTVAITLTNANGASLDGTLQATLQNGVATFSGLSMNKAGTYTLTPTIDNLTGITCPASNSFTISPGAPAQLVWGTQPGGGTGGKEWDQQPVLYLEDANGNVVTDDSTSTVTLALTDANGATLGGMAQVTLVNGVAAFGDLKIDKIGTYTLKPTSSLSGITSPESNSFDITLGAAAQIVWHTQPGGGVSGEAWSQQPVLYLEDAGGNIMTTDSSSKVALTLTNSGAALSGTTEVTLINGVVNFSDLAMTKAGTYTLTPSIDIVNISSPASDQFTIIPGPAAQLVWHTQPGGGTGGTVWAQAQQPVLYLEDANGNILTNDNNSTVTIELTDAKGAFLGGNALVALQAGTAAFAGLKVDKIGSYTLTAGCGNITTQSNPFDIVLGPAAQLEWHIQPVGAAAGSYLGTQPALYLEDAGGNIKTDDSTSTVTIAIINPGGATLDGTKTVTLQNGEAVFTDLTMYKTGSFTLTASSNSITSLPSNSFTVTSGPATQLIWQVQPGGGTGGVTWPQQPVLALEDAYGNVVTSDNSTTVTVALKSPGGATLGGTATMTLLNGEAAFPDLKVDKAGTYNLILTSSFNGIPDPESDPFTIAVGPVARVTWQTQPVGAVSGTKLSVQPVLQLEDAGGNIRMDDNSSKVTISVTTGGATLLGTVTATAQGGTAAFTDLEIDKAGSYNLVATSGAVTSSPSASFVITPGAPTQLVWLTQPGNAASGSDLSPQPVLALEDVYGNIVTYDNSSSVEVSLVNPVLDTLRGTRSVTLQNGKAFFSGLKVDKAGSYTMTASCGNISSLDSSAFTITSGAVYIGQSTIVINADKSSLTLNADGIDSATITVKLQDTYGNVTTGAAVTLDQGSGSSVITAVNSTTDADGIAIFTVKSTKAEGVVYTAIVDNAAVTGTVEITFTPGAAEKLIINASAAQTAGVPFNVTVTALDHFGNIATGYTGTVELTSTDAAAVLPGSYAFAPSDKGVYTFSGAVMKTPGGQTITASDTGTGITATTGVITVITGPADPVQSAVAAGKPAVIADGTDSTTITVTLKDACGNPVSGKKVALAHSGNSTVIAVNDISAADGTAIFNIKNTKAETVICTAVDTTSGVVLQNVQVVFIAGPVDAGRSAVTVDKSPVSADGTESSTIAVTLKDAYDNPVSGIKVTLDQGTGSSVITIVNDTSGNDGTATFTVKGTKAETVTYTASAGGVGITQAASVDFIPTHTVNVSAKPNTGGTVTGGGTYYEGDSVTVNAAANSGYRFVNWTEGLKEVGTGLSYTFKLDKADRTLTANFSPIYTPGSGNPAPPENPQPIKGSDGNVTIPVTPKIDNNSDTATAAVNSGTLESAFDSAKTGENGVRTVVLDIAKVDGAEAYESTLPASFLNGGDAGREVKIKTDIATMTVPGNMVASSPAGAQNVSLTMGIADKSTLPADVQVQVGDRPVLELSMEIDGKQTDWNNPGAPVTVTLSYTPTAEELKDPEHITVWYIDGSGNVISVPSGRYDPATGKITFTTTHFSRYAVTYVTRTYNDLSGVSWAKKPIETLASKGILKGVTENRYAPQTNITRADFMYFLIRTLNVEAAVDGNFDDIDVGAYYYKEVGIAKKLGITSGVGKNKFNPNAAITRQDMMVLTDKALRMLKKMEAQGSASDLEKYADKSLVAGYAVNSVASIVKEGLVVGSGSKVNPLGNTTRAEAAVILYKIYNKY